MECVYLERAEYVEDYIVYVTFNDGKSGVVDLKDIIYKYEIAYPLRDVEKFSNFYLDSWPTIAWDCGFDVAPETLYEKCDGDREKPHGSPFPHHAEKGPVPCGSANHLERGPVGKRPSLSK